MKRLPMRPKSKRVLFNKYSILLGVLPAVLLFTFVRIIPSVLTWFYSFTNIRIIPGFQWEMVGTANYQELMLANKRMVMEALGRTMKFSLGTTFGQVALALIIALLLNNKFLKGRTFFRSMTFLPVVLGVTICGLSFTLLFAMEGPMYQLLALFGKTSQFFGDWKLSMYLVVFCQIWCNVGGTMIIFLAALQSCNADLTEAARIDGANNWTIFWHVTMPQIMPTFFANLMMCLTGSLGSFEIIIVTTGGSKPTTTLAMLIYTLAFGVGTGVDKVNVGRQGLASAAQIILFLFILFFTLILRFIQKKVEERLS